MVVVIAFGPVQLSQESSTRTENVLSKWDGFCTKRTPTRTLIAGGAFCRKEFDRYNASIEGQRCEREGVHMKEGGAYGNRLGRAFGMEEAATLITRTLNKSAMAVTEIRGDGSKYGKTAPIPREDAYLVALQLRPCHDHDLYFDGRRIRPTNWFAGVTSIYDLRRDPIADLRDPFHCLMFYLPRKALDSVAYESGVPRVGDLHFPLAEGIEDPVLRHLLSSLLPAIVNPGEAHPLFLDHIALALSAHVAHVYGGMSPIASSLRGGLAPWQERSVKELMSASMQEEVPLSRLAAECGLSVRHFTRAFQRSTGVPPHRWLMKHRVDCAREMLSNRALSLTDIALACGFADQSHFTRVFTATLGVSPGAWRRANSTRHDIPEN